MSQFGHPSRHGVNPIRGVDRRTFLASAVAFLGGGVTAGTAEQLMPRTAFAAVPTVVSATKTVSTFYTPDRVAAMRSNVEKYGWAQTLRDEAVERAAVFIAQGEEWLWNLVPTQGVPRSYAVNQALGSPITGKDIYSWGAYPWTADPLGEPWKIVDPSVDAKSGEPYKYPTNDFAAYYRTGLDATGSFDASRADRSLLINRLYPERGPEWGVDDGFGWIDANGKRWTFVAYYAHWYAWLNENGGKGLVHTGVKSLRDAYLYTGDPRYARAGLILLDRIADIYPGLHLDPYPRADYLNAHGSTGRGKAVGSIWETWIAEDLASAYDAFFPMIATTDSAGVIPFLSAKQQQYTGLASKNTAANVRQNIENGILRIVFPAVKDAEIRGNFGMHQMTLAMAAIVLDDPTASPSWIDWIFKPGELSSSPAFHLTGGEVYTRLINDVDRDGCGNEASVTYNRIWMLQIRDIAEILARSPDKNLYLHPKVQKLFDCTYPFTMVNRYVPGIGDSTTTGGPPWLMLVPNDYVKIYEQFRRPVHAQMAYLLNEGSADGLYGDIASLNVEQTQHEIKAIISELGELNLGSTNLTGFGFTALRTGTGNAQRDLWVYYGRNSGHGHQDTLNLGMHAFGIDVLPDLGYPELTGTNARRMEWNGNTVAHNTVVVDSQTQEQQIVGQPKGFAATPRVRFVDIAAPQVYSQTATYRRGAVLIDVDETNSYAVDIFRILGGVDHHYSFHAAEGPATTYGLNLITQPTGSYAGPDVNPPADNARPRPRASGFDWLSNVERDDDPAESFVVDWAIKDTWNVSDPDPNLHLRLTMLTQVHDVALADGIPARNKPGNPARLRYLLAHRHGGELASQFTAVVEPYVDTPLIRSARRVDVHAINGTIAPHEAAAVRVELANGRIDYIVNSTRPDVTLRIDGSYLVEAALAVWSTQGGRLQYACQYDGRILFPVTPLAARQTVITGTVRGFSRELTTTNTIEVQIDRPLHPTVSFSGSYVYVENNAERNAVYRIESVRQDSSRVITLELGNASLINSYIDLDQPDLGYVYDLAIGDPVRIPLATHWSR